MGKKPPVLSRVAAQFFSDTHTFHPYNGGVYKHLQKLYASTAEKLFFVGDVTDFEYIAHALGDRGFSLDKFPTDFKKVLEILKPHNAEHHLRFYDAMHLKAAGGTEVTFLGGNHDEGMDLLDGLSLDDISIKKETVYDAGKHGRYHVEHGQHFDEWFGKEYSDWVSYNACRILDGALKVDFKLGQKMEALKEAYPFTNVLKGFAKSVGVVKPFKKNALAKAFEMNATGVIAGHIHKAANKTENYNGRDIQYINTGDGLTHGTSWGHSADGQWRKIKRKHLPKSSAEVLEAVNPIEEVYREQTWMFLQTGWSAQLAYLHSKAEAKKSVVHEGMRPVAA